MPSIAAATVRPARRVRGRLRPPGDKSISHRYALLAALADGRSTITRFAPGADCAATLSCLRALGVEVTPRRRSSVDQATSDLAFEIAGLGVGGLHRAIEPLDARNSGTTLRLLAGVLAAHPFSTTLTGDSSLTRRPMRRIVEPLTRMGARIVADQDRPPLTIQGARLRAIDYTPDTPSAQVKSAVLLAGLHAGGVTRVAERVPTRNHTELALRAFGAEVNVSSGAVSVKGGQRLAPVDLQVPGDLSSAAFWAAAAAALPGSDIELEDVGLNPTRTALLDALTRVGARVEAVVDREENREPRGRLRVRHDSVAPLTLGPAEVPGLIDELPVLAALATRGGELQVTGASELRVKESDRIGALVQGLRDLGANVEEFPDGFHVRGNCRLRGGHADAAGDHRLAMAFAIAALGASGPSVITGAEAVNVSYPGFFDVLQSICE